MSHGALESGESENVLAQCLWLQIPAWPCPACAALGVCVEGGGLHNLPKGL